MIILEGRVIYNLNHNNRSTTIKHPDLFIGSNFELFIHLLHREILPTKSGFSPLRAGFTAETGWGGDNTLYCFFNFSVKRHSIPSL